MFYNRGIFKIGIIKNVLVNILNLLILKNYFFYRYKRKIYLENFNILIIMKELLFVLNF